MTNDPVLAVAIRAAHRAASVIVDAARDLKRRPSHAKDLGDLASEAETEAENAIIATLRAAFPDHAIVGEETGEIVSQIAIAHQYEGASDKRDGVNVGPSESPFRATQDSGAARKR